MITGSLRGIGRGIALKLAQGVVRIAVNYLQSKTAAEDTLRQVRAAGSDGFLIQADVAQPGDIRHLFNTVQAEFGQLAIFVSNARPEAATFFHPPLEITLEQWDTAVDGRDGGRGGDTTIPPDVSATILETSKGEIINRSAQFQPFLSASSAVVDVFGLYWALAPNRP